MEQNDIASILKEFKASPYQSRIKNLPRDDLMEADDDRLEILNDDT